MATHFVSCSRCGRPAQPAYTGDREAFITGHCSCNPPLRADDPRTIETVLRDAHTRRDAELARLRAELEQAKSDVERWAGSSGFYSDSLAMANESAKVLQEERDKYAAALVEIRGICTAMMDGWGQTVTVLDKIRKITLAAIKRQPGEPAHRPETFA